MEGETVDEHLHHAYTETPAPTVEVVYTLTLRCADREDGIPEPEEIERAVMAHLGEGHWEPIFEARAVRADRKEDT
jgi:hypothetical protein